MGDGSISAARIRALLDAYPADAPAPLHAGMDEMTMPYPQRMACPYCGGEIAVEVEHAGDFDQVVWIECGTYRCGATWGTAGQPARGPRHHCPVRDGGRVCAHMEGHERLSFSAEHIFVAPGDREPLPWQQAGGW